MHHDSQVVLQTPGTAVGSQLVVGDRGAWPWLPAVGASCSFTEDPAPQTVAGSQIAAFSHTLLYSSHLMAILDIIHSCNTRLQKAVAKVVQQTLSPEEVLALAEMESTIAHLRELGAVSLQQKEAEIAELVGQGIVRFGAPFSNYRQRSIQSNLTNIFGVEHSSTTGKIAKKLLALATDDPDLLMVWAVTMLTASWTHNSMSLEKYEAAIVRLRSWAHPPWQDWMLQELDFLGADCLKTSVPFGLFRGT